MLMKTIKAFLITSVILATSACSWMTPPTFDSYEYSLLVKLETHSRFLVDECADEQLAADRINTMLFEVEQLKTYTHYLPANEEMYDISTVIAEDVNQLHTKYDSGNAPSVTFCKLKTKVLITNTRRALKTFGDLQ